MPRTSDEEQERARREMADRENGRARRVAVDGSQVSPVQAARAARDRGDRFLEVQVPMSTLSGSAAFGSVTTTADAHHREPDLLGRIEDEGWHLETADYVFVPTSTESSRRPLLTGERSATSGYLSGVYLFRRT